jgi:hypothetical protein
VAGAHSNHSPLINTTETPAHSDQSHRCRMPQDPRRKLLRLRLNGPRVPNLFTNFAEPNPQQTPQPEQEPYAQTATQIPSKALGPCLLMLPWLSRSLTTYRSVPPAIMRRERDTGHEFAFRFPDNVLGPRCNLCEVPDFSLPLGVIISVRYARASRANLLRGRAPYAEPPLRDRPSGGPGAPWHTG